MIFEPQAKSEPLRAAGPSSLADHRTGLAKLAARGSKLAAAEEAAEIAEAAMVLPLVFMILLGTVWFGRAFNIYSTIAQAAQQGAITAARSTCATCTSSSFPSTQTVADTVTSVMQASSLDTTQVILYRPSPLASCSSSAPVACDARENISVCSNVLLNAPATAQPPQCGTMVSFQYPFTFPLPLSSLSNQRIVLTAEAQSRLEQ